MKGDLQVAIRHWCPVCLHGLFQDAASCPRLRQRAITALPPSSTTTLNTPVVFAEKHKAQVLLDIFHLLIFPILQLRHFHLLVRRLLLCLQVSQFEVNMGSKRSCPLRQLSPQLGTAWASFHVDLGELVISQASCVRFLLNQFCRHLSVGSLADAS